MTPQVLLPKSEQAKLNRLIKEMQKATGAEMQKVVRNVARDVCYAAQRLTPAVKAGRRPVWVRPKGAPRGTIVPWHRGGKILMVSEPGGLTKAVWSACLTKLGKARKGGGGNAGGQAMKWASVKRGFYNGKIFMEVSNNAPYIEDFNKGKNPKGVPLHIEQRAWQEVVKTMEKRLTKMAQRVVNKAIGF